jgi:hypothetical protein
VYNVNGDMCGHPRGRLLEMSVNVDRCQPASEHEHLKVIEQLRYFFCSAVSRLVLRGHPHFGSFFNDLLADRVDTCVKFTNGARPRRTRECLLAEFSKKVVESLHCYRLLALERLAARGSDSAAVLRGALT